MQFFFPSEDVLQQNRIRECTSNGPSCTHGASGCAIWSGFSNVNHPEYLDITHCKSPFSGRSGLRVGCLKTDRMIILNTISAFNPSCVDFLGRMNHLNEKWFSRWRTQDSSWMGESSRYFGTFPVRFLQGNFSPHRGVPGSELTLPF